MLKHKTAVFVDNCSGASELFRAMWITIQNVQVQHPEQPPSGEARSAANDVNSYGRAARGREQDIGDLAGFAEPKLDILNAGRGFMNRSGTP